LTLAKPDRVDADIREIERILPSIRELYRWAYGWVLSSSGTGLDGGGRSGFSDSDPTGDIASDKLKHERRRVMGKAAGKVLAAMESLYAARNELEAVVGPIQSQIARSVARDALVTKAEFGDALDAQDRRMRRGEAYGDSALPRL